MRDDLPPCCPSVNPLVSVLHRIYDRYLKPIVIEPRYVRCTLLISEGNRFDDLPRQAESDHNE